MSRPPWQRLHRTPKTDSPNPLGFDRTWAKNQTCYLVAFQTTTQVAQIRVVQMSRPARYLLIRCLNECAKFLCPSQASVCMVKPEDAQNLAGSTDLFIGQQRLTASVAEVLWTTHRNAWSGRLDGRLSLLFLFYRNRRRDRLRILPTGRSRSLILTRSSPDCRFESKQLPKTHLACSVVHAIFSPVLNTLSRLFRAAGAAQRGRAARGYLSR